MATEEENYGGKSTADDLVHVHLPGATRKMLDDIKEVRARNAEPLSYTAIVVDAIKAYHRKVSR